MDLSFKKSVGLATTLCLSAILGLTACTKEVVTEKVIQGEEKNPLKPAQIFALK